MCYLHPLLNVGDHFNAYLGGDNKSNKELAFAYFREFGLGNANLIWHKYSYELSGGEASRVQIALALCLKPKILICDEITSGLDSISGSHVTGILESLKGKMSVIFISHDEPLTNYLSDEIWQMRDGRLNLKENA